MSERNLVSIDYGLLTADYSSWGSAYSNTYVYRPYLICYEEIDDARIISNLTEGMTRNELSDLYDSSNTYFGDIGFNTYRYNSTRDNSITDNNILEICPYKYIATNVDFTNAKTLTFQVRFGEEYTTKTFQGTGNSGKPINDDILIYNPTISDDGSVTYSKNQEFVNAFTYMKRIDLDETSGTRVMQLKGEEYKGVYDFILVYEPFDFQSTTGGSSDLTTFSAGYYLYAYRHTNVFLKILANDPAVGNVDIDGTTVDGLFQHENTYWDNNHPNALIFQKEYHIGTYVTSSDTNEEAGVMKNMDSWVPTSSTGDTLKTCVDNYVNAWVANGSVSKSDVKIRDHVTGPLSVITVTMI